MSSASPELTPMRTHVVRAGAGAGKTRALTLQVMEAAKKFKRENGRWPRIVVTTFTRKATQELRERLMLQAMDHDHELIDFVNSRAHLAVSTIHGILDVYLKRYGGHLKIDPNYRVIDKAEALHLARKAMRSVLFQNAELQTLLEMFDFRQLVSMARQFHEIRLKNPQAAPHTLATLGEAYKGVADEIAMALKEASAAIRTEAQGAQQEAWLDVAEEFSRAARVLAQSESRVFVKDILDGLIIPRHNPKNPGVSEETKDQVRALAADASAFIELQDPALWPLFIENFERFETLALTFSERLMDFKVEQGALEMSDLELFAMESMRKSPATAKAFNEEWDFWLIDEYQDTSPFQVQLLRALMGDKPAFIVGDPQQSIYLFRGARSEVFVEKESEVLDHGGQRSFLTTNYRSRPELLLFFNELFGRMEPPFSDMQVKPGAERTGKDVARIFIAPKIDRKAAETRDPEIDAITAHVLTLLADGAKPESICVLARTHQTLQQVSSRLAEANIPVHIHASAGFYERREIQDALALLRFLLNPHDNVNLVQLLRSPWFRVDDERLAQVAGTSWSLWTALTEQLAPLEAVSRLRALCDRRSTEGLAHVFRAALIESGLLDSAQKLDPSGRREANLWKLLTQLHDEEARPGFNPLEFVNAGLNEILSDEGGEENDAVAAVEPNRVNLMTVHASKGLAFDHVIVPRLHQAPRVKLFDHFLFDEERELWSLRLPLGVERKSTPSIAERVWLKVYQEHERREHARVLYVALTRARESVFLSFTGLPMRHSWADLMKLDLAEGEHKTKDYTYRVVTRVEALQAPEREKPEPVSPRKPWSYDVSKPTMKSVSVSRLLERVMPAQKTDDANNAQRAGAPLLRRIQVSSQGTAIHKLMEMLKYRTREQVERLVQQWFPQQTEKVTKAIAWMGAQTAPPIMRVISEGYVEWGFAFLENGLVVEGQIDLWGRCAEGDARGEVWVIDYKTGSPENKEQAFRQLNLYALALHRAGEIQKGDRVRLAVIYPFIERIEVREASPEAVIVAALWSGVDATDASRTRT